MARAAWAVSGGISGHNRSKIPVFPQFNGLHCELSAFDTNYNTCSIDSYTKMFRTFHEASNFNWLFCQKSVESYQGHTGRPNQKHQPYVFSGNTRLGFQLAGAAGCRLPPFFQPLQ